ncbi:hypothetical protein C8A01DRAFT_47325 [Parachaetomium inaequale]|uniref:Uncharacterized protein n=1 Tax=Parachaetomium inaequale TaxID=2588326 RepID=A0AAN6PII2_9PEZI|nr:hypothetical protein C8A01DRAFT_47325 [Parachaetomium inaequale]
MAPTPTLPEAVFRLLARQQPTTTVVVDNGGGGSTSNSGLDGGAIAGIVIGTIVGILLIWWIIRACTQPKQPDASRQGWYDDTAPPPRGSRSRSRSASYGGGGYHHHRHHGHHHSARRSHSRRRSSTPRPVVLEEKYAAVGVPRRPSATYAYAPAEGRRSRSRSQGRYYGLSLHNLAIAPTMCTYDYTPYTGCEDGPQHYYIQWVKCSIAVEKGRYCSLDASHKVEQLRKLSANVLSCPLHGPIAVQQFVLDSANSTPLDDEAERARARSTTRRAAAARGRTPKRGGSDREVEQPVRRPVRKQRSRREIALESSDSESSSSFSARPRAAERVTRMDDREPEAMERRRSRTAQAPSHSRSISADIALPPPLPLFMRHGRSEVSLPLKTDFDVESEDPRAGHRQSRPKNSLDIPRAIGVVGLPSSPDMHRRGSVHRSRSESGLGPGNEGQQEPLPAPRSALSPASDSSPDQNPELPFSTPGRRGRRAGARSIRDRSVDTTMRRIDEHVENPSTARETATSETHSSTTTSPEPHPPQTVTTTFHRRSNSRPHLNSLQIPKNRDHYQRDAYSAPTATPPETEINTSPLPKNRARSLRHVDISPLAPLPLPPQNPYSSSRNDGGETASIRSTTTTRSRRFEDQVAEGRKWVAAREHIPMPTMAPRGPATDTSLPLAAAAASGIPPGMGRESVDSGSWETVRSVGSVSSSSGGRNTLQKMPPQQQGQGQGQGQGQSQGQQRPVPAPLNLSGVPPCALPVSLMSPGFQSDADGSPVGKGAKGTLLQRIGLRRKFSGLVFKGGQREVGVEG